MTLIRNQIAPAPIVDTAPSPPRVPDVVVRFPEGFDKLPTVSAGALVRFEDLGRASAYVKVSHYAGMPVWTGELEYEIDGQAQPSIPFARKIWGEQSQIGHEVVPVDLQIPASAREVKLWLKLRGGETTYYSNFGTNFTMQVKGATPTPPPASTAVGDTVEAASPDRAPSAPAALDHGGIAGGMPLGPWSVKA